jgi:hypothetical protein
MEQMSWLAPWLLTELWFSTLKAPMPRCCCTGEECDASSSRRMAGGARCERNPRVAVPDTNNPETMIFNHCRFAIAPTTALCPQIQGVL